MPKKVRSSCIHNSPYTYKIGIANLLPIKSFKKGDKNTTNDNNKE
jgi:hypothetical protein